MSVGKTIFRYFQKHKFKAFLIILAIVITTILSLLPAQILKSIVDTAIPNGNKKVLILSSIAYTSVYLAVGISSFLKNVFMLSVSQEIAQELKLNMMRHVQKMSYKELVAIDSGTLEAYFNNDVNSFNELFTSGVIDMITDIFKMIGIVISIFIFSTIFGFIVLGALPILVLFTTFVRKRMMKASLKTKSLEGNVNKMLLESVENIEQIKVNKAEGYSLQKYNKILKNHFNANQQSNFYDAIFSPVMQIIRNAVVCIILLISGYDAGIFGMTIGEVIAAITLLADLFTPVENIGMEIQTIQKSVAAVKRINEFFLLDEIAKSISTSPQGFDISFKNVDFAYDDRLILKDFSLNIKEGTKIALQGPSGSGKSTIMRLAMGLISPTKGSVEIGGVPNSCLNDQERRNLFAVVYQDPFFSGGSIYEEISLLDSSITKEMVANALREVGLGYITNLDARLNDKEYSSGELALFNIARVIVKNPKVIFLDEMNAKIDPITGRHIISLINKISCDKTVISINHYGDTLDNAIIIKMPLE